MAISIKLHLFSLRYLSARPDNLWDKQSAALCCVVQRRKKTKHKKYSHDGWLNGNMSQDSVVYRCLWRRFAHGHGQYRKYDFHGCIAAASTTFCDGFCGQCSFLIDPESENVVRYFIKGEIGRV